MVGERLMKKLANILGNNTYTLEEIERKIAPYYKNPKDAIWWWKKQGILVCESGNKWKVNYVWFEQFKAGEKKENGKDKENIPHLISPNFDRKYIPRRVGKKTDVEILKEAFERGLNVLLVGETGTGKTHAVYYVARLLGRKVKRVNLDKATTPEDLIGCWQPTANGNGDGREFKWVDGVLIEAMKDGYVFVCDEINAAPPEVLFLLNSVLDERKITLKQYKGEVIEAHPNFVFVATMNPSYYEGVNRLNEALRSRFQIILFYDYDERIERKLGLDERLIKFARKVREGYRLGEVSTPLSTRDLIYYHNNSILFGREVAKEILLNKFDLGERDAIKEAFELIVEGGRH